MKLLIEHKRKLFKVLLAAVALYSIQWTQGWLAGLFNYVLFSDVKLISVVGALLVLMLYWYHKNEI